MPADEPPKVSTCLWCKAEIREVTVLTGPLPGVDTRLWIGVDPDPDGQVILRSDKRWRTLAPNRRGARTGWRKPKSATFRIHNRHSCDPTVAHRLPVRQEASAP